LPVCGPKHNMSDDLWATATPDVPGVRVGCDEKEQVEGWDVGSDVVRIGWIEAT
jgi:hypothetical protein